MMITKKEVTDLLDYDEATGVFTRKVSMGPTKAGTEAGCVWVAGKSGKSYRQININGRLYYAHRIAWLILTGAFPEDQIDHIDGNGLNNKAVNLRSVTRAENQKNMRKHKTNTSGVTGVHWNKDVNKWQSRIYIEGNITTLGYFKSFDEAVKVRKAAEKTYNYHPNHGSERPL